MPSLGRWVVLPLLLLGLIPGPAAADTTSDRAAADAVASFDGAFAKASPADRPKLLAELGKVDHRRVTDRFHDLAEDDSCDAASRVAALHLLAARGNDDRAVGTRVGRQLVRESESLAKALRKNDFGLPVDRRTGEVARGPQTDQILRRGEERAAVTAAAIRCAAGSGWRPKEAAEVLRPFVQSPHDDVVTAALGVLGDWKETECLPDLLRLFRMYPRENRWETGAVVDAAGNNATAKAAWMTLFGHPLKQRPRPIVFRTLHAALQRICARDFDSPDELESWMREGDRHAPDRVERTAAPAKADADETVGGVTPRMKAAIEQRQTDVRTLAASLTKLGASGSRQDMDFLVEFVAVEPSRALRLFAVESLQRIDASGACDRLLERPEFRSGRLAERAAACVEAVGLLGDGSRVPALLDLLGHRRDSVALAAADALARVATNADAAAVAARGLQRDWVVVAEHCGFTVLDLLGGDRVAAAWLFGANGTDPSGPRARRATAVRTLLLDSQVRPHRWEPAFATARKALGAAPEELPLQALNPEMDGWFRAGAKWLREKSPGDHWMACASLKSISYSESETRFDAASGRLFLSAGDAALTPERWAALVVRYAGLGWRKRLGEPHAGRRAWDAAAADEFDLLATGGAADAKATTRETFIDRSIRRRLWER